MKAFGFTTWDDEPIQQRCSNCDRKIKRVVTCGCGEKLCGLCHHDCAELHDDIHDWELGDYDR